MRVSDVEHFQQVEATNMVALRLQCMDRGNPGGLLKTREAVAAQRIRHPASHSLEKNISRTSGSTSIDVAVTKMASATVHRSSWQSQCPTILYRLTEHLTRMRS